MFFYYNGINEEVSKSLKFLARNKFFDNFSKNEGLNCFQLIKSFDENLNYQNVELGENKFEENYKIFEMQSKKNENMPIQYFLHATEMNSYEKALTDFISNKKFFDNHYYLKKLYLMINLMNKLIIYFSNFF